MLQLIIVGLVGAIAFLVFKGREVKSDKDSFSGSIAAVALLGIALGAVASVTPTVLPFTSSFSESVLKAEYEGVEVGSGTVVGTKNATGTSVSVSVSGSSAQAQVTTQSLLPSTAGAQLMAQLKKNVKVNGRTVTGFTDPGNNWAWYVIDTSLDEKRGQPVVGSEYAVQNASVRSITYYLAKDNSGIWEFGPKEVITLP